MKLKLLILICSLTAVFAYTRSCEPINPNTCQATCDACREVDLFTQLLNLTNPYRHNYTAIDNYYKTISNLSATPDSRYARSPYQLSCRGSGKQGLRSHCDVTCYDCRDLQICTDAVNMSNHSGVTLVDQDILFKNVSQICDRVWNGSQKISFGLISVMLTVFSLFLIY